MSEDLLPELFDRLVGLDRAGRRDLLERLRADRPTLVAELERLLVADESGESSVDRSPWQDLLAPLVGRDAGEPPPRIGPYRPVRELGRGGMGRVFLAEEETADFRRSVALKIIDHPGVDGEAVRRFRDEVRILATLEHPGIARFFDGGRTAEGTWFLALEYVEGEDLLSSVRRRGLRPRGCVELFLQVLDAVDFAHRRLVVHRDLKPSNVLIGADGRAKLLDFGISKILEADAGSDAVTRPGFRALTPAYASPEQLRGERATIAADIYSLGVVLYEILAGRRPFARSAIAGEELARRLASEPEAPSVAARRKPDPGASGPETPPVAHWRELAGDLDAITLKALRAEPENRYPSAAALAQDLRRWLGGRPVEARRGGRRYRVAKFLRRHRVPATLAALAAVVLAGSAVGIVVQSRRATREAEVAAEQRDFALRQLSRAEAINELNSFLLSDAAPGGRPFTVGALLERAERVVARQPDAPLGQQVEMMIAVGRELQSQDQTGRARSLLSAAYERARSSEEPTTRARAACALAHTEARAGEPERAAALVAEGLARLGGGPLHALTRVYCLRLGGEVAREAEDGARALEHTLEALRILRSSGQGSELLSARLASDLAESYRLAGREREAGAAFADALARLEALGYGDSETAGTLYNNWALTVRSQGAPLEAERLFRRAVAIASAAEGLDSVAPVTLTNLGYVLTDLHRHDEARELADRAFELARRQGDEGAMQQALFLRSRARLRTGQVEEAAALMEQLGRRLRDLPVGHPFVATLESQMGLLAAARGDLAAARAAQDRALSMVEGDPTRSSYVAVFLLRRAGLAFDAGEPARARDDAARALERLGRELEPGATSFWVGRASLLLGRSHLALGEREAARARLAAAAEHLEPTLGADHPETRAARELLAAAAGSPDGVVTVEAPIAAR